MTTQARIHRIDSFLENMKFARDYTKTLLDGLSDEQWFWSPQEMTTHIGWQVGHLAMAQYGLCLFRQRGRRSEDTELMSSRFRKLFMKGTTPKPDAGDYPSPMEIVEVLDRVHRQVLTEVPTFADESLDEAIDPPTAGYATKYGSLLMAVNHEMLHAGQIGLLRRLMGQDPVR